MPLNDRPKKWINENPDRRRQPGSPITHYSQQWISVSHGTSARPIVGHARILIISYKHCSRSCVHKRKTNSFIVTDDPKMAPTCILPSLTESLNLLRVHIVISVHETIPNSLAQSTYSSSSHWKCLSSTIISFFSFTLFKLEDEF